MNVEIRVGGGDDAAEFPALYEWLRGERALAGMVNLVQRVPEGDELGGVFEMLTVALGSGGAAAVLAQALTTWIRTRHAGVTITVTSATGRLTLDADGVNRDDVMPILQEILRRHDAQSP